MEVVIEMTLPGQGITLQILDIERPENKQIMTNWKLLKKYNFDIPINLPDASNSKFNFKS